MDWGYPFMEYKDGLISRPAYAWRPYMEDFIFHKGTTLFIYVS